MISIPVPIQQFNQQIEGFLTKSLSPQFISNLATKLPLAFNGRLIEFACKHIFYEQLEEGEFNFLKDRIIVIHLNDANLFIGLGFDGEQLRCNHFNSENLNAEAQLSIGVSDAISLIKQEIDPDTLFFQRRLKISGDTELAHHVKNTIDTIDPEKIPTPLVKALDLYRSKVLSVKTIRN